ncbi:hypothetical protein [Mariluticola halotolerans]|uniref:hypothetical protein n=1 Tax=Mariluticola halotolerans TaxID=2909283 RepID=UPI0026E198F9|nr:hypothetical protein [Mariluticola halotolerans]UJQ93333.1 hypothetical protein L1P08_10015 [Mariluticola halotolerans]
MSFVAATNQLGQLFDRIENELKRVKSARSEYSGATDELKKSGEVVAELLEKIQTANQSSQSAKLQIDSVVSELTALQTQGQTIHASIEEVASTARKLHASVEEYQKKFDEFDGALNTRQEKIASGEIEIVSLHSRLVETEKEIEDIKKRSIDMLDGATIAGLAGVYKTKENQTNKRLGLAAVGFWLSIFLLFLSAVPLIGYALSPFAVFLNAEWKDVVDQIRGPVVTSDWQYISQVFSRLVILLPAAWLVRITTGRYNSLFRLREQYGHKYAIASSVEGFKRQAPDFQSEVVASTFEELMYNSIEHLQPEKNESKPPNRILNFLLNKLRGAED